MTEVKDTDDDGQTLLQLPVESHNDSNFREELRKPIDKYDWMSFQKISRQVFFPESERFIHCKCEMEMLRKYQLKTRILSSVQSIQGLKVLVQYTGPAR